MFSRWSGTLYHYCILGKDTSSCTCTIPAVISSAGIRCILFVVFFCLFFLHDIFSFLPWIRMNSALLCSLNMLRKRIHTYVLKRCVKILYMCSLKCILHGFVWKIMPRNKLLKSLSNLVNTF